MRIYLAPKALIIEEMGYLPLDEMGATIFFQLASARYERGRIIRTPNKSYADWGSICCDPIIATAILERLLHHSTTVNIRGESFRLKEPRRAGVLLQPEDQREERPTVDAAAADRFRGKSKRSRGWGFQAWADLSIRWARAGRKKPGALSAVAPGPHRLDESAAEDSLAGCSPAWLASASPADLMLINTVAEQKNSTSTRVGNFQPAKWGNLHSALTDAT